MKPGDRVTLRDEADCIIPAGEYTVSKVNPDGSFHVGGRTAVWPIRVVVGSGSGRDASKGAGHA